MLWLSSLLVAQALRLDGLVRKHSPFASHSLLSEPNATNATETNATETNATETNATEAPKSGKASEVTEVTGAKPLRCELRYQRNLMEVHAHAGGLDGFLRDAQGQLAVVAGVDEACVHVMSVRGGYDHWASLGSTFCADYSKDNATAVTDAATCEAACCTGEGLCDHGSSFAGGKCECKEKETLVPKDPKMLTLCESAPATGDTHADRADHELAVLDFELCGECGCDGEKAFDAAKGILEESEHGVGIAAKGLLKGATLEKASTPSDAAVAHMTVGSCAAALALFLFAA